jgi:hypothetical protein
MTGFAKNDACVVKYTVGEIASTDTMAHTTIGCCCHMGGQSRLTARIDTVVIIMTVSAWLYRGINTVVEYTTETESRGAMAGTTIDGHDRMAYLWPRRISAIVTASAVICDATVIRIGIFKTGYRMTERAIII